MLSKHASTGRSPSPSHGRNCGNSTRQSKIDDPLAVHAAVGLDLRKHERVDRLLGESLRETTRGELQRLDTARVAVALQRLSPTTASVTAEVLSAALSKTTDRGQVRELVRDWNTLIPSLAPEDAAR